jgi:hypothetical protein
MGDWVDPRAGLDIAGKRNVLLSGFQNPAIQPVVYSWTELFFILCNIIIGVNI